MNERKAGANRTLRIEFGCPLPTTRPTPSACLSPYLVLAVVFFSCGGPRLLASSFHSQPRPARRRNRQYPEIVWASLVGCRPVLAPERDSGTRCSTNPSSTSRRLLLLWLLLPARVVGLQQVLRIVRGNMMPHAIFVLEAFVL